MLSGRDRGEGRLKLRVRILAWVHIALGGIGLAVAATILLLAISMAANDPAYQDELALFWGILGMVMVAVFIPLTVGGVALLTRRPWARAAIWISSAPMALVVPLGTMLAGLNVWVLLTTREESPDGGMARFEQAVHRAWRGLALLLIGLFLFGVIIGLGWLFRDAIDPPRPRVLTPMPTMPPRLSERREFKMPDPSEYGLPRAPER